MTQSIFNPDDLLAAERYSIPKCESLEQSILEKTNLLQQESIIRDPIKSTVRPSVLRWAWSHFWTSSAKLKPLMGVAVTAMAIFLIYNAELISQPNSQLSEAVQEQIQIQSVTGGQSMDPLDWQELLLLQDEMAFASL